MGRDAAIVIGAVHQYRSAPYDVRQDIAPMRHAPLAGGCEDLWAVPVSCRSSHPAAHEIDSHKPPCWQHTHMARHRVASVRVLHCDAWCALCALRLVRNATCSWHDNVQNKISTSRLQALASARSVLHQPVPAHDACNGGPRAQADSTARVDAWDINHQRLARHCMRGSGCVAGVQGMVVGIGKWSELRSVPGPGLPTRQLDTTREKC